MRKLATLGLSQVWMAGYHSKNAVSPMITRTNLRSTFKMSTSSTLVRAFPERLLTTSVRDRAGSCNTLSARLRVSWLYRSRGSFALNNFTVSHSLQKRGVSAWLEIHSKRPRVKINLSWETCQWSNLTKLISNLCRAFSSKKISIMAWVKELQSLVRQMPPQFKITLIRRMTARES